MTSLNGDLIARRIQQDSVHEHDSVPVIGYCGFFALMYCAFIIVLNIFGHVTDANIGHGANIGTAIGAAAGTAYKFTYDQSRPPSRIEKRKLIWGSLAATFLVSTFAVMVLAKIDDSVSLADIGALIGQVSAIALTISLLLVTAFYYFILNLAYGWIAGRIVHKKDAFD